MEISKPKKRGMVCTILAEAGMGKTTLAATFPAPIFIRCEDGMQSIPEDKRPDTFTDMPTTGEAVQTMIKQLIEEPHEYKTLVVDTITTMDQTITDQIVKASGVKSINQAGGGYGAGVGILANYHRAIRGLCDVLATDRGMHVCFLAHATVERLEPPDMDPYSRYSMRMHEKCQSPYIDNVDLVGYIKQIIYLKSEEQKPGQQKRLSRALSSDERVLVCYSTPTNVSKNRYGIKEDLPYIEGENPIFNYFRSLKK